MDRYWVPHKQHVFAPCTLKTTSDAASIFVTEDGEEITVPKKDAANLFKVLDAQLMGVDNVCTLEEVNPGAVLNTVRVRYARTQIYTRVARILIAVNPFQPLNIYSAQYVDQYMKASDSYDCPPHIYGIGLDAVMGLRNSEASQAVLISGESGAGKTESTKLVLSYVAEAIGGASGNLQEKIMQTNPVLESFGNAMTVRNNNSSRFGKWLEMRVDRKSGKVIGCSIIDYLLEVTRVCSPGAAERNYHVFSQITLNKGDELLKDLDIMEPKDYKYLAASQLKAPGIDDKHFFEELREAFSTLNFDRDVQIEIFKVVAGILSLGNLSFKAGCDEAALDEEKSADRAAKLLGVQKGDLMSPILVKKIVVGKEVTEAPRKPDQATSARDGLARLLYGRLFKWLVKRINGSLTIGSNDCKTAQFFGVLDIAGFECFEKNSLEQLFINLSNEQLQQHFNNHVFKSEMDDYVAEGVDVGASLVYEDNADIVQLIQEKGGILAMLDEEVALPKGTDQTFISKMLKAHEKHKRMIVPKFSGTLNFGIRHFAGEVTYSGDGFLEKNVDKPPDEAPSLLMSSSLSVMQELGKMMQEELAEAASAGGGAARGKKQKTVGTAFKSQLTELLAKLSGAEPHFIRCVKPNAEKVPNKFSGAMAMDQLICSGVMEAVKIRQSGFSARVPFKDFLGRYKAIIPRQNRDSIYGPAAPKEDAARGKKYLELLPQAVQALGGIQEGEVVLGKTKVFVRARLAGILEKARDMSVIGYVIDLQRIRRGINVRRLMKGVQQVHRELNAWDQRNPFYKQKGSQHTASATLKTPEAIDAEIAKGEEILAKVDKLPFQHPQSEPIRGVVKKMANEASLLKQLKVVLTSMQPVDIEKVLARVKDLDLPQTGDVATLQSRIQRLKVQVPLHRALQTALESKTIDELQDVLKAVKTAGLHQHPEDWLPELNGMTLAGDAYALLEDLKAQKKLDDIQRKRREDLEKEAQNKMKAVGLDEETKRLEREKKEEEERLEAEKKAKEDKEREEAEERKRRRTVTGLSQAGQEKLLIGILAASHEYDVETLEAKLGEAMAQGVEPKELQNGEELLKNLQSEDFIVETMKHLHEKIRRKDDMPTAMAGLKNLIKQANTLEVAQQMCEESKMVMQAGVRQRARSTIRGSLFDNIEEEELTMLQDAFQDLAAYEGLKSADGWRGHVGRRRAKLFRRRVEGDVMLVHGKKEIKAALTAVPNRPHEKKATQCYRDILGWMYDRPVPEMQRLGLASAVIECAQMDQQMGDEVYVQIMKQMTQNPSKRSVLEGWRLLLLMCQQVAPSTQLEDFVRSFVLRHIAEYTQNSMCNTRSSTPSGDEEVVAIAKQCIADLNLTAAPNKLAEVTAGEDLIPMQVYLIDNSTRKAHVKRTGTIADLVSAVATLLRIETPEDFGIFQMIDGTETHRLLPTRATVEDLPEKFSKLQQATGKASRLLYKRKFLSYSETLSLNDMMHATLTYRQVVYDYLHYPISEDADTIAKIAATLVCTDEHFKPILDSGKLAAAAADQPGTLERLIPQHSLRDKSRSNWAKLIEQKARKEIGPTICEGGETQLHKMSRILSLVQELKLFGSYFWLVKQIDKPPPDLVTIPNAPDVVCKINPKGAMHEWWACLDIFGLRFVSVDSAPGKSFQRGFLFNEESLDRVLQWGAKKNVLQLVVKALAADRADLGREHMSVTVTCPAAPDIAHVLHVVTREKKVNTRR
eukprot:TRINITY_DN3003_c0_g2_i1.p1 TRINITY_DN3003_c0_g2~~TRINITY_DN3003_c0_g2_i1.p1  ORF type:complete len:1722 (+),score=543.75 TRINITY_DN3003_c0_g2_i1:127-5292(+)